MATTDPAAEAAQQVLEALSESQQLRRLRDGLGDLAETAARKALAPVRELHQAFVDYHRPHAEAGDSFSAGVMHAMRDLAFLIYTSEELDHE